MFSADELQWREESLRFSRARYAARGRVGPAVRGGVGPAGNSSTGLQLRSVLLGDRNQRQHLIMIKNDDGKAAGKKRTAE